MWNWSFYRACGLSFSFVGCVSHSLLPGSRARLRCRRGPASGCWQWERSAELTTAPEEAGLSTLHTSKIFSAKSLRLSCLFRVALPLGRKLERVPVMLGIGCDSRQDEIYLIQTRLEKECACISYDRSAYYTRTSQQPLQRHHCCQYLHASLNLLRTERLDSVCE